VEWPASPDSKTPNANLGLHLQIEHIPRQQEDRVLRTSLWIKTQSCQQREGALSPVAPQLPKMPMARACSDSFTNTQFSNARADGIVRDAAMPDMARSTIDNTLSPTNPSPRESNPSTPKPTMNVDSGVLYRSNLNKKKT
jgi:hypothetical protein